MLRKSNEIVSLTNRNGFAFVVLAGLLALQSGCLSEGDSSSSAARTNPTNPSSNQAPTISGSPSTTIVMGSAWSFRPNAADANGDTLSFSIENKPDWAAFDSTTGRLSGTPTLGNVGFYSNIGISVSDGALGASLPRFDLEVIQDAGGSVTLSWEPPTLNTDGSTLTDLAGYKIYYGTSQGNYPNRIDVNSPGLTAYVVENLAPDTYYFAATAVNLSGTESALTAPVSKQVD